VPESSLNIAYLELQSDVGVFFGYGAGNTAYGATDTAWTTAQTNQINKALKSGLRRFYFPEPLMGEKESYNWSFLKPTATLSIPEGGNFQIEGTETFICQVPLPDDFGGFEGKLTIVQTGPGVSAPWYIDFTNEGRLRELYSFAPTRTGRPELAAQVQLKGTGPQTSSRSALMIWPLPDQAYVFQAQYYINPDFLSGAYPYAYGGTQHAETLREACLAAAETYLDDTAGGNHDSMFMRRLAASVALDRRNKPLVLGYNRDRSDYMGEVTGRAGWLTGGIMYNGVQYGE
jgi:hypothetical protein